MATKNKANDNIDTMDNDDSTPTMELSPKELMEQAIAARDLDYINAHLANLGFVQNANVDGLLAITNVAFVYGTGQMDLSTSDYREPAISGSTKGADPHVVPGYRPKVRRDDSRKEAGTYFIKEGAN